MPVPTIQRFFILSAITSMPILAQAFVATSAVFGKASTPKIYFDESFAGNHNKEPKNRPSTLYMSESFVDVQFESVDESSQQRSIDDRQVDEQGNSDNGLKSLVDLSLESDPKWKKIRVPFIDSMGRSFVDCKMAFEVDLDGVSYYIGTPFDSAAAIYVEFNDGSVEFLDPDDDENEEIMQIFASKLQKHYGEDLTLKRTPQTLTIEGDLDSATKGWKETLVPEPFDAATLTDEEDEDLKHFDDFMRKELGDDYKKKLGISKKDENIDDELLKLFDVPGLGMNEDDKEGIKALFEDLLSETVGEEAIGTDIDREAGVLKLVWFKRKDGTTYSLVRNLQPVVLVGKEDPVKPTRRVLLTPEEEELVMPKLEKLCHEELAKAGLL